MHRVMLAFIALTALPLTLIAQVSFTVTSGMPVTMEVITACTISASDMDFGAYKSADSPIAARAQTSIQLHCAPGATLDISLDAGTSPGGNTSQRKLASESTIDRLDYDLYQNVARTTHWGDNSGRDTLELESTGEPQTVRVFGEIPAGQRARDGTYSDTITVQVLY